MADPHPTSAHRRASTPAHDPLAERYGRRSSPGRNRVLLALLTAGFLVIVTLVGLRFADQPVRSETLSYRHVDSSHIAITFQVTAHTKLPVACTIQALDATRAQVGFTEVNLPARTERQSVHTVTVATQGEAVSGQVMGCTSR